MSARWFGARRAETVVARDLLPGDRVRLARGQSAERVTRVAHHDDSQTVDLLFESGRRATFRYDTDVTVANR